MNLGETFVIRQMRFFLRDRLTPSWSLIMYQFGIIIVWVRKD